MSNKMYQVSSLQALALGYSRAVVTVGELLQQGDTGLGTYEDVNGEMIVLDGINMPGWHLHFLSEDRMWGGHVFDVAMREGSARHRPRPLL